MGGNLFSLVVLSLVGLVTAFGAHVADIHLPYYARQVGMGPFGVGVLLASYNFSEIVAKPIFGYISDKRGRLGTMLAGLLVFSFGSLLFLFLPARFLIVVRLAQGLGAAALSVVSMAMVATLFPKTIGLSFGIYNALKGAGLVLSPLVGGVVGGAYGFAGIFVLCFVVGITVSILVMTTCVGHRGDRRGSGCRRRGRGSSPLGGRGGPRLRQKRPRPGKPGAGKSGQAAETGSAFDASEPPELGDEENLNVLQFLRTFKDPVLVPWYLVIVVNMLFMSSLFGFLPVFAASLGYGQVQTGFLAGMATVSYLLIQPVAGLASDRIGKIGVIFWGAALSGAAVAAIPFLSAGGLAVAAALAGAGVGMMWTAVDSVVAGISDARSVGLSLGAAGTFKELGDMTGPMLMGGISQLRGLRTGFVSVGLLGLFLIGASMRRWISRPSGRGRKG